MTIGFILNGEDVTVQTDAENRLINVLRDSFGLLQTKTGCLCGNCGACLIILNGDVAKSCLIPAFNIMDSEIITIEGFSLTDEYNDIITGFSEADVETCGFCNTGKILATEAMLGRNSRPSKNEILAAFQGIKCRCTEPEELAQGVIAVAEHRRRRLYGRSG